MFSFVLALAFVAVATLIWAAVAFVQDGKDELDDDLTEL